MELRKLSLKDIKEHSNSISIEDYPELINQLEKDDRKTIHKLASTLQRKYNQYRKEEVRLEKIKYFEKQAYNNGYTFIAGIDEVGRGPLAGPVVSAAVILPKDFNVLYIKDSKKLSRKKREELYYKIYEKAIDVGIGMVDAHTIDNMNIFEATKLSMKKAVENLEQQPNFLLIDALRCEEIFIDQQPILQGDSRSISIAAASIVAKVTRDKIMDQYNEQFPEYYFNKNKGYGTEEHRNAILNFGISSIHRKSFLKNILGVEKDGQASRNW